MSFSLVSTYCSSLRITGESFFSFSSTLLCFLPAAAVSLTPVPVGVAAMGVETGAGVAVAPVGVAAVGVETGAGVVVAPVGVAAEGAETGAGVVVGVAAERAETGAGVVVATGSFRRLCASLAGFPFLTLLSDICWATSV